MSLLQPRTHQRLGCHSLLGYVFSLACGGFACAWHGVMFTTVDSCGLLNMVVKGCSHNCQYNGLSLPTLRALVATQHTNTPVVTGPMCIPVICASHVGLLGHYILDLEHCKDGDQDNMMNIGLLLLLLGCEVHPQLWCAWILVPCLLGLHLDTPPVRIAATARPTPKNAVCLRPLQYIGVHG